MATPLRFAYFGGEPLSVPVLEILKAHDLVPSLVVASPDRPAGRKLTMTPPPVKVWAEAHRIPVFQPETLKERDVLAPLTDTLFDVFVVVAYNKILPEWLIELPTHKTLNLHPSLLPQYRGASPIRTAILENNQAAVGASVMLMDKAMDSGPILAQEAFDFTDVEWPTDGLLLDALLAEQGGKLLAKTIARWVAGDITPQPQDHEAATYCSKISRADGELKLDPQSLPHGAAAVEALLKIRAFAGWPGTFFMHDGKRIKVNDAHLTASGALMIGDVTPEGKKSQSFSQFLATLHA